MNLAAEVPGLLRVDTAKIDRLNAVDESLTIGTLPDYAVVAPKDLVATIKVIPFAVPGSGAGGRRGAGAPGRLAADTAPVSRAEGRAGGTELPGLKDSITEKTVAVTEAAGDPADRHVAAALRCPHEEAAVATGAGGVDPAGCRYAGGCRRLGGGGPTRCRAAGIVRAGGEILHFGMPVDPGNLICLGRIGDAAGTGAARLRAQPEAERHRLHAAPAVRRPAGRAGAISCAWASAGC